MRLLLILFILIALVHPAYALEQTDLNQDRYCFRKYGQTFGVDPDLLEAISWVESKHDPTALNRGPETISYGHMQINSYWIEPLLGEEFSQLDDPCFCTAIGAYILSSCINNNGLNQNALSCYNSGKSLDRLDPDVRKLVERYITQVQKKFQEMKQ